jgi:hypothetical protein
MSCHANHFAPFGQKDCADFTQKGRKSDRRFSGAGHLGVTSTFPPVGAIWAPFNLGGPFLLQHSQRNGGYRDPDTRG